ncbi:MAG: peptidyl-prolyl cis-trans isomerase [Calditrichaeota bacterium]|nr:MAG: peptidyl-prolyl cis-trans isomerase [Calditrichota bacterium]
MKKSQRGVPMRKQYFIFLIVLFVSMVMIRCGDESSEIVARIGTEEITKAELIEKLKQDYRNVSLNQLSLEDKRKSLNKLLDERRKLLKAKQLGLEKDPKFQQDRETYADRLIAIELYNQLVRDVILPEKLLRQYYDWMHYKIKAVIINVGYQGVKIYNRERTREEALQLAQTYRKQLEASSDPEKTAHELSDDQRNRPVLNPYRIGRFTPKLDSLVFSAGEGDVIGPVDTDRGFIILKILQRQETSLSPYESIKNEISNRIRHYFRTREKELFDQYTAQFDEKYHVEFYDDAISNFLHQLQEWGVKENRKLEDFTPEQRGTVLAVAGDVQITVDDFLNYYKTRLFRDFRKYRRMEDLKNGWLRQQVTLKVWTLEGKNRGLDSAPHVQEELHQFEITRLSQLVTEKEIDEKINITDEEIEQYYNEHREKYKQPEKIQVWQICLNDEATAKKVAQWVKQGKDMEALYKKYMKPHKGQTIPYSLGLQTRNSRFKDVVEKAFEMGPNKLEGPIEIGGDFFIIKTGDYIPEQYRTLEQVKNTVHSEIFNQKRKQREKEFLKEIREEFAFRINESTLRDIG